MDLSFDRIDEPRLAGLWRELALVASGATEDASPIPAQIAAAINENAGSPGSDQELADHLGRLAAELRDRHSPEAIAMRQLVSELVSGLLPDRLRCLVDAAGDRARQREFLRDVTNAFAPEAALPIFLYASSQSSPPLSISMRQLLFKLTARSVMAEPHLRSRADALFREQILELIDHWWVMDGHDSVHDLDRNHRHAFAGGEDPLLIPGDDRLVQMSLEVDAVGLALWGPVTAMIDEGRFRELLEMLKRAPAGNRAARVIAEQLSTPRRLKELLEEDPIDFQAMDRLLEHMGSDAARLLVDELCRSETRSERRGLFDRIARMGRVAANAAIERLQDERWYVQRNVLGLLTAIDHPADQVSLDPFLRHGDARVRIAALRMMTRFDRREQALGIALRDRDPGILQWALFTRGAFSESLVPILIRRLTESDFPQELRPQAILLLTDSRSPATLEMLLRNVQGGRSFLGRTRLAPRTPAMIASLSVLARSWADDRRAAELVAIAARSHDPQIRAALEGTVPDLGASIPTIEESF